ncbi:MAG TPA: hypothetical protein VGX23_24940 [Actinocrinis sp.]|nr:hypothetical protein [Actinocrinis sp.]
MDERATTPTSLDGALARALAFLEIHGNGLDRARQSGGAVAPPVPQNPDGGWPSAWSAGASAILGTCQILDHLDGLELAGADRTAALRFLAAGQAPDGSWSETAGLAGWSGGEPPEWLRPGSSPARAYLTAYSARVLLVCAPDDPEFRPVVDHAAEALEWSLDPHGRLPGPLPGHWFAARVFRATDRVLQARRLLDVVGRLFDQLDVADLASFGADIDPADRWARRIAVRLLTMQDQDGSWSAEGTDTPALTAAVVRVLQPTVGLL